MAGELLQRNLYPDPYQLVVLPGTSGRARSSGTWAETCLIEDPQSQLYQPIANTAYAQFQEATTFEFPTNLTPAFQLSL